MIGPAKNRLHDYEAGWLTLLVNMRVAMEAEARRHESGGPKGRCRHGGTAGEAAQGTKASPKSGLTVAPSRETMTPTVEGSAEAAEGSLHHWFFRCGGKFQ